MGLKNSGLKRNPPKPQLLWSKALMSAVNLCFAIIWIGLGILNIFFKDLAWKLNELGNDISGRASKRTARWEFSSTIMGIIMLFIGLAFFIATFAYSE
jgi:hypothetical protein